MASTIAWYAFEAFTAAPAEIFVSSKILKTHESSYVTPFRTESTNTVSLIKIPCPTSLDTGANWMGTSLAKHDHFLHKEYVRASNIQD